MVPFWTSFIVRTYGIFNLHRRPRPARAACCSALGIIGDDGLHLLYTPLGVAIGIVYSYLPLMILPLYVALERIDPALLRRRQRPRRRPAPRPPPGDPAAGDAGHHRRLHPRRHPGDGRVRDPGDPRRRQDADDRQRRRRPVPRASATTRSARRWRSSLMAIVMIVAAAPAPRRAPRRDVDVSAGAPAAGARSPRSCFVLPVRADRCSSSSTRSTRTALLHWGGFTWSGTARRSTTRRCARTSASASRSPCSRPRSRS